MAVLTQFVAKSYLYIFVCLATRAVHLELAAGLSLEAFVAVVTQFVARCGCPESDKCFCRYTTEIYDLQVKVCAAEQLTTLCV